MIRFRILRRIKLFFSMVIFFFIAAQAFAGLIYHPGYHGDSYFPFMDYPMFKATHDIGSEMPVYHVFGLLDDGSEVEIIPKDLDLDFWKFEWGIVQELRNKTLRYAKLRNYAQMYEARSGKRVTAFRLENHPRVYSGSRMKDGQKRIIKRVDLR